MDAQQRRNAYLLETFGAEPLWKNATHYDSRDWRELSQCSADHCIQRQLMNGELVLDFDDVTEAQKAQIVELFKASDVSFEAWSSSEKGLHVHIWTDVWNKMYLRNLARFIGDWVFERLQIKTDLQPMSHGFIRAEFSLSPKSGAIKYLYFDGLSPLRPINKIEADLYAKISHGEERDDFHSPHAGTTDGTLPPDMRYIMSHRFIDGRDRLLFAIVSWYKASGVADRDIFLIAHEWCKKQDYPAPPRKIWAKIYASKGQVGKKYRTELLEELGVDINDIS